MRYLTLILGILFAFTGCGKKADTNNEREENTEKVLAGLDAKWSLETNSQKIIDAIKESELFEYVYASSDESIHLNRPLTENEVENGNKLIKEIIAAYNDELGNKWAAQYYESFLTNESLYNQHCIGQDAPHTMLSVDRVVRTIVKEFGYYRIKEFEGSYFGPIFNSYWYACRYLTSDMTSKSYMKYLIENSVGLHFPVKFKKSGGLDGGGKIQSLHGAMISDFCIRAGHPDDGLDTLGLCP